MVQYPADAPLHLLPLNSIPFNVWKIYILWPTNLFFSVLFHCLWPDSWWNIKCSRFFQYIVHESWLLGKVLKEKKNLSSVSSFPEVFAVFFASIPDWKRSGMRSSGYVLPLVPGPLGTRETHTGTSRGVCLWQADLCTGPLLCCVRVYMYHVLQGCHCYSRVPPPPPGDHGGSSSWMAERRPQAIFVHTNIHDELCNI